MITFGCVEIYFHKLAVIWKIKFHRTHINLVNDIFFERQERKFHIFRKLSEMILHKKYLN